MIERTQCFLLDMDGTFYVGERLLPGALDFMRYLQQSGRRYLFVTNNSSCSAAYYAAKLTRLGWNTAEREILTSGEACALYLRKEKPDAAVFLLGTPELERELAARGLRLTESDPDFVVLGFDKTLTYEKLEKACCHIRRGVPFVATHPDINCPTEDGFIPDCGAMIELIRASTGISPYIIGKPHPQIIEAAFAKTNTAPDQMAMVGDRLYTDIATGKNAGIASVLVLSGETKRGDLEFARFSPDYIFENLGELAAALRMADRSKTVHLPEVKD